MFIIETLKHLTLFVEQKIESYKLRIPLPITPMPMNTSDYFYNY